MAYAFHGGTNGRCLVTGQTWREYTGRVAATCGCMLGVCRVGMPPTRSGRPRLGILLAQDTARPSAASTLP